MDLELVTVGTELLLGFTVDTNGAELGRRLAEIGIRVTRRTSVGDGPDEIGDAVAGALARAGAVLTTGGLGPTRDDVTKEVVARLFGLPLEFREDLWAALLERYKRVARLPVEGNRCQAEVPRGATVLPNRWGSAPGLWIEGALPGGTPGLAILLPGVPREMRKLLEHEVVPRLTPLGGGRVVRSRTLRTTGIPESTLAERIGDAETALAPLTLAYLPGISGVDLRVTAWDFGAAEADRRLAEALILLESRAAGVFGRDDADLASIVLDRLRAAGQTIGTAESCTGGMIGARITSVPGASAAFLGGFVAYDDRVKAGQLGVPEGILAAHGAVSESVVTAMAEAVRGRLGADWGVGITGIAGPDGGTPEKPVGLVWIAVAGPDGTVARQLRLFGDREEVRARATDAALALLLARLPQ
ncbi:MAG TPA: competence/damage-inducible protein A [Gemmatimonadales bacterium]|nr:competence/damage-inducible protein A [Gemmatimonadales bacterium]